MNIRHLQKSVLLITTFMTTVALAGPGSSGGGNAVVCTDTNNKVLSAELLDLYEGRALNGLKPIPSTGNAREQAEAAAKLIDIGAAGQITFANRIAEIESNLRFLPSGTGLRPVNDSNHIVVPKSCKVMQVARYEHNDVVYIDSDIWNAMDEQNRGALLLHEAVYWGFRIYGEKNSDRARRAVALAFAGTPFESAVSGLPETGEECIVHYDKNTEMPWAVFGAYPDPEKPNSVVLQFVLFEGKPVLSKTTLRLSDAPWPLSDGNKVIMYSSKLESLLEPGLGIMLRLTPASEGQTGRIGIADGFVQPKMAFTCRKK